jgi:5-methylcytosine-specific restriction endonuclease McrA
MTRRPDHLGKRRDFSPKTKAEARARADGHCEGCGTPFADDDPQEVDHITPDGLGGKNTLDNAQVLGSRACLCHPKKTADDITRMAKADRKAGRSGQYARRMKAKAQGKHRPIQSRGFQTNKDAPFKKKFNGEVEKR